jgi:hypothetical protein
MSKSMSMSKRFMGKMMAKPDQPRGGNSQAGPPTLYHSLTVADESRHLLDHHPTPGNIKPIRPRA